MHKFGRKIDFFYLCSQCGRTPKQKRWFLFSEDVTLLIEILILNIQCQANWFETTVRYERQTEDGQKKVNETYVVDALTFGEAEEVITKEMEPYVSGDFNVKSISPASYGEIFFSDNENDSHWYKAKLAFVVVDEKTAKEKRSNVNFLVQAASFNAAVKNIDESMGKTAIDYEIVNIADTKIMDVFEHNAPLKKEEKNDKPEFEG